MQTISGSGSRQTQPTQPKTQPVCTVFRDVNTPNTANTANSQKLFLQREVETVQSSGIIIKNHLHAMIVQIWLCWLCWLCLHLQILTHRLCQPGVLAVSISPFGVQ